MNLYDTHIIHRMRVLVVNVNLVQYAKDMDQVSNGVILCLKIQILVRQRLNLNYSNVSIALLTNSDEYTETNAYESDESGASDHTHINECIPVSAVKYGIKIHFRIFSPPY